MQGQRTEGPECGVLPCMIQPAHLWLWVIGHCEALAACIVMTVLHVQFQFPGKRRLTDMSMETFNGSERRRDGRNLLHHQSLMFASTSVCQPDFI